jgi:hypothetical protein
MNAATQHFSGVFTKIKTLISQYKLSEFINSSLLFSSLCSLAMLYAFSYGLQTESRELIVFTPLNAISSFLLFCFGLWMTKSSKLPDRYYSWSSAINYLGVLLLIPYLVFIDNRSMVALAMSFFFINIFNLCILLHLLNFRSNYHHDWNALRKLTSLKSGFNFKLSMGVKLHVLMPVGLVTIYFDKICVNGVDYDLYDLTKYFETHDLDLNTATDDDFKLFEMIRY